MKTRYILTWYEWCLNARRTERFWSLAAMYQFIEDAALDGHPLEQYEWSTEYLD